MSGAAWTRRALIKAGGLALFSAGFGGGPSFLARAALASPGPAPFGRRKVLVTIFQRGAMDGLAAVSPLDEERLRGLRPRLAMSAARGSGEGALLDLGVGFGLHPALGDLLPLWRQGRLAVVHAVGSPDPTRSHFDAQDFMETGTPGRRGTASGWLNRVSGELGHEGGPVRSLALRRTLPRSLYGPEPAIAVGRLEDLELHLRGGAGAARRLGKRFNELYEASGDELLRTAGREALEAAEIVARLTGEDERRGRRVRYPSSPLGQALRQIARLIRAEVGLEIAFAESHGWDTHVLQGADQGSFARRARDLAASIAAFWRDLGPYRDDVVLMTMTEFGRTVRENGAGGTDHGHGSCLFVVGGGVDGGKVHGRFPTLAEELLHEGRDLPVTTDFRAVFSEVAGRHFGIEEDAALFPGWTGQRLPLLRKS